ncbi:hypothetical protein XENTR_v10023115 [Xenopus tropicalis]|nr:hypothetical protein XENTR_v10023115 [Xenopus tropicalis]
MRGGRVLTVPARSTVGGGEPITALHSHKHRQASVPYQVSLVWPQSEVSHKWRIEAKQSLPTTSHKIWGIYFFFKMGECFWVPRDRGERGRFRELTNKPAPAW